MPKEAFAIFKSDAVATIQQFQSLLQVACLGNSLGDKAGKNTVKLGSL
jgi:hypothetical protein